MRILVFGNAGSGKTTMARALTEKSSASYLSLDSIAWKKGAERLPAQESTDLLTAFIARHPDWVIEGCYGSLVEAALAFCTELRFLNPGVEVCVQRCRERPWEPDKFSSPDEQRAVTESLIRWVRDYETRDDEFGLRFHRRIFEGFSGPKAEYHF